MSAQWTQPSDDREVTDQILREAHEARFGLTHRVGYDPASVDLFFDSVIKTGETGGAVGPLLALARFHMAAPGKPGYDCRQVDELLDRWMKLTDASSSS